MLELLAKDGVEAAGALSDLTRVRTLHEVDVRAKRVDMKY